MGFVECQRRSDVRVYAPGCLMERKHDCAEGNRFVVDDDPAVGTALKRLIRSVGIEALTFTSGGTSCVPLDWTFPAAWCWMFVCQI